MAMSDNHDDDLSTASEKLQSLLTAAGFIHEAAANTGRHLSFSGQYRDWLVFASAVPEWFHIHTFICSLPTEPGLRSELLLWLARANSNLSLLKYSVTAQDRVVLECEIRFERIDEDDVRNVIWFLHSVAERDYRAILEVASGDKRLEALADAFKRDVPSDEGSVSA
jgi:hypothetical protein